MVTITVKNKIQKRDLPKLLSEWSSEFTIYVPSQNGVTGWAQWNGKDTDFMDWYRNTNIPPKSIFLPLIEKLFSFHRDKDGYHIEIPPLDVERKLIFGIRPCDARALSLLDMNFCNACEDPYYLAKRKGAVLVGLTCTKPYDSCFCTSLGISPSDSSCVDLLLTDIGDDFLVEATTDKGRNLLNSNILSKAVKYDEIKAKAHKEEVYRQVTRQVNVDNIQDRLFRYFENEEYWSRLSQKCVSCGICTMLCPTCYCFDINDKIIKNNGERFRNWDSCAFPIYTKMPMENPRLEKWRRLRQKICHKYEFYPMTFGVIACTGCGRCIRLCPVKWDIALVINNLPNIVKYEHGK